MITDRDEILACIDAEEVVLGQNVTVGANLRIGAIHGRAGRVVIGDNAFIGNNVLILVPEFSIGDFSKIHQSCRITGYKPLSIGHNAWVDQNNILNSSETLTIGNNVGIGSYCQFWTHVRWGDTVIGCRFDADKPLTIHDDVYYGGLCLTSPVEIGPRCMIMGGSVVTRNLAEGRIYGGNPAIDLTEKLGFPYREVSIPERLAEMKRRIGVFFDAHPEWPRDGIEVIDSWDRKLEPHVTYFNVADRTYSKRGNPVEVPVMLHLLPTAKFLPRRLEPGRGN